MTANCSCPHSPFSPSARARRRTSIRSGWPMSVHPIDLARGLSVHSSEVNSVKPGLLDRDHSQSRTQLAVEASRPLLLDTPTARLQLPPIVVDYGPDPLHADSRTGLILPSPHGIEHRSDDCFAVSTCYASLAFTILWLRPSWSRTASRNLRTMAFHSVSGSVTRSFR